MWIVAGVALAVTAIAAPAHAGYALVDLADSTMLEEVDSNTVAAADDASDLLLVMVVRERITSGALGYATLVPVVTAPGDTGPVITGQRRLAVGELLQLLLLGGSRSAAMSLAAAAGPGNDRARARLRRSAARLQLRGTTISEAWPVPSATATSARAGRRTEAAPRRVAGTLPLPGSSSVARTTVHDLAVLAGAVAADPEIRRRLALDGAPIADGALIVRATDPLIALAPPAAVVPPATTRPRSPSGPATRVPAAFAAEASATIALAARDGLELVAVASGSDPVADAWRIVERGLSRFERVQVVRAGQRIGGDVDAADGGAAPVAAIAAQPFAVTVRRGGTPSLSAWRQLPAQARGPIEANQPMGELIFEQGGRIIGAVPLVAPGAIAPLGWLDTARR